MHLLGVLWKLECLDVAFVSLDDGIDTQTAVATRAQGKGSIGAQLSDLSGVYTFGTQLVLVDALAPVDNRTAGQPDAHHADRMQGDL